MKTKIQYYQRYYNTLYRMTEKGTLQIFSTREKAWVKSCDNTPYPPEHTITIEQAKKQFPAEAFEQFPPLRPSMKLLELDEITYKVTEYADRFLVSGHFKPLDMRAGHNITKVEPDLVSLSQLLSSYIYNNARSIIKNKMNKKFTEIAEILKERYYDSDY